MNTHSTRTLVLSTIALIPLSLAPPAWAPDTNPLPVVTANLCAAVPERMPLPGRDSGELRGLSGTAATPDAYVSGLLGTLGQMIVEAELSHAAVSGRFEPVISAAVAGSAFTLEVCRNSIAGEVSVADQPRLRFVIGDFNGDGTTDVAVRPHGSRSWSVHLGAGQRATVGLGAPALLIDAVPPAAAGAQRTAGSPVTNEVTWLAGLPSTAFFEPRRG